MPTYQYLCQSCSTVYEERRRFAQADDPSHCPECSSPRVRRLLSTFIIFSPGSRGDTSGRPLAGGGCACSAGGACGCSAATARAGERA
jgi:putative FmdB family regulatory protein